MTLNLTISLIITLRVLVQEPSVYHSSSTSRRDLKTNELHGNKSNTTCNCSNKGLYVEGRLMGLPKI